MGWGVQGWWQGLMVKKLSDVAALGLARWLFPYAERHARRGGEGWK